MKIVLSILLISLAFCIASEKNNRVLVLVDDLNVKTTHSLYFKSVTELGFELTFSTADNTELALQKYGEYLYDHLILFAPTAEDFGGSVDVDEILNFIDSGHNVIVAASPLVGSTIRELAVECGVEFDEERTYAIDHLNYDSNDDGQHTLIVADNYLKNQIITGSEPIGPILFQGIAQEVEDNGLLLDLLTGSSSSYSHRPDQTITKYPFVTGKKTVLVSALQARNNARVVFSGSLDVFSNKFFTATVTRNVGEGQSAKPIKSGNSKFFSEVTQWTFQQRGVLRFRDLHHEKLNVASQPRVYTVNDSLSVSIIIEEFDGKDWHPYQSNDVQLEFIMLDPYVRTILHPNANGVFSTQFVAPDVYGVYTFKVDYHRPGYSSFLAIDRVVVRPYMHDQYERFIESAYPYYSSSLSMLVGLFLFGVIFLYHKEN